MVYYICLNPRQPESLQMILNTCVWQCVALVESVLGQMSLREVK